MRRRSAYRDLFNVETPGAQVVLSDLRIFCRGTGSKWAGNTEDTLRMIGRNEVWERIQSYANMTDAEVASLIDRVEVDDE